MIQILNRWTGAVLYESETAQTIAEAVAEARRRRADLSEADLNWADLREADLSGANLSGANLRWANGLPLGAALHITGSRHPIVALNRERVWVGCQERPLAEWLEVYHKIGQAQGYTADQIEEYSEHLEHVARWIARREKAMAIKEGA